MGSDVFSDRTRLTALDVLGSNMNRSAEEWRQLAVDLSSAVVAVAGDLDRLPAADLPEDALWKPYIGLIPAAPSG